MSGRSSFPIVAEPTTFVRVRKRVTMAAALAVLPIVLVAYVVVGGSAWNRRVPQTRPVAQPGTRCEPIGLGHPWVSSAPTKMGESAPHSGFEEITDSGRCVRCGWSASSQSDQRRRHSALISAREPGRRPLRMIVWNRLG